MAGLRAEGSVVPVRPGAYRVGLRSVAVQVRASSTRVPHVAAPRTGLRARERSNNHPHERRARERVTCELAHGGRPFGAGGGSDDGRADGRASGGGSGTVGIANVLLLSFFRCALKRPRATGTRKIRERSDGCDPSSAIVSKGDVVLDGARRVPVSEDRGRPRESAVRRKRRWRRVGKGRSTCENSLIQPRIVHARRLRQPV